MLCDLLLDATLAFAESLRLEWIRGYRRLVSRDLGCDDLTGDGAEQEPITSVPSGETDTIPSWYWTDAWYSIWGPWSESCSHSLE